MQNSVTQKQVIDFILRLSKMHSEANELGLDIELDDVLCDLVWGIYPSIFGEEFPQGRFNEKS